MAHDTQAQAERPTPEQESRLHAEQIQKSRREVVVIRESMLRGCAAITKREQQAIRVHEREMEELRRQTGALETPHRSFFWWLNPVHLILAVVDAF